MAIPVIAIYDIGKTNKKIFLFDEHYKIVFERSCCFSEIQDEDGEPCEDLASLKSFIFDSLEEVLALQEFDVKAINFSTYGASFVYLDVNGTPVSPLYNYLKPYPESLKQGFYQEYGDEEEFSKITASPVLGSLNSGLQLYRIKHQKPALFSKIKYALHLPQYMSYLISGSYFSDITSIGCHTALWNFDKNTYHHWVQKEGISEKFAPLKSSSEVVPAAFLDNKILTGIGLHDSSAALIPYLANFNEPFILISTGTWCISLNPFNHSCLTPDELKNDCLCYLSYDGNPVKASRLFAGFEHEQQVKRLAEHFQQNVNRYKTIDFNSEIVTRLKEAGALLHKDSNAQILNESLFASRDLSGFDSYEDAYHQLMIDIVAQQFKSTQLVLRDTPVKRIFVDGGFSKNRVYMNLLAHVFPGMEIFAASMAQATALGSSLAIHSSWNSKPLPSDMVELKYYYAQNQNTAV